MNRTTSRTIFDRRTSCIALLSLALAGCGGGASSSSSSGSGGSGSSSSGSSSSGSSSSGGSVGSGYPHTCTSSSTNGVLLTTCDIAPSTTGTGISALSPASGDTHHVVVPTSSGARKDVLVVFLGGSLSVPSAYQTISAEAASKGYGVFDLRYPDSAVVGLACGAGPDSCFANQRGMTIFGNGTTVPGVAGSPYTYDGSVSAIDSIMNRVVNLLDLLATYDTYWAQFLTDTASPYTSAHHAQGVLPNWSKVVFAGHSQGGGDAVLIGTQIAAVRRLIAFSAPDDHVGTTSASWVTVSQTTAELARFWGMRDTMEGTYGECTSYNWHELGGANGNNCVVMDEAVHAWELFVDQGATKATGQQFLVTTDQANPPSSLYAHDASAVDDNGADGSSTTPFSTDRTVAWDYLFTANGMD